ncbi:MAG: protein kinase domain-containing protein [Planctomycetota bacterium]
METFLGEPGSAKSGRSGKLGPYEIPEEIGQGGMGVVYKAFHPQLKRTVALKVLIAGEDASEEAIQRFHREAEAVAKLGHHPNIVPVHDIGVEGKTHYFAMHFVEGKPLDKLIDEGKTAPKRAALIAKKLAEALHHAHQHGVLHRDVKPANVLMAFTKLEGEPKSESPNLKGKKPEGAAHVGGWDLEVGGSAREGGEPMLTDFGLAKDVQSDVHMTRTGMTLGTPHYMPPEQADGRLSDIDERSDVYSLGATLYEMLTSRPPFEGSSIIDVIKKALVEDPAPPRKRNPLIDRDLETICLKALEKKPARRFRTARAFAEDLGRYLENEPIVARPVSILEKLARRVRRNRWAAAGLAFAIIALVAGGILGVTFAGRWMAERSRAERERGEKEREERLRSEAEVGREDAKSAQAKAEAGELEARERLEKTYRASRVLIGANTRLGRIHGELKGARYDSRKTLSEIREVHDRFWEDIEAFCRSVPEDPTSQATALAVKSWLSWLGGETRECMKINNKAMALDPDVPYVHIYACMVLFSQYLLEYGPPRYSIGTGGFEVFDQTEETHRMQKTRKALERFLQRLEGVRLWGKESKEELQEAFGGFWSFFSGDLATAERGLTRAMGIPELGWIDSEIRLARAIVRLHAEKFNEGLEDAAKALETRPHYDLCHRIRAALYEGLACSEYQRSGKDLEPNLRRAIDAYETARTLRPHPRTVYRQSLAKLTLAEFLHGRGRQVKPETQWVVKALDGILEKHPNACWALHGLGDALFFLGNLNEESGENPCPPWERAVSAYGRALRLHPKSHHICFHLCEVQGLAASCLAEKDKINLALFDEALENVERAARLGAPPKDVSLYRGRILRQKGQALAHWNEDPESLYRSALVNLGRALALEDVKSPRLSRARIYIDMGEWRAEAGGGAAQAYEAAVREATQEIETYPPTAKAWVLRGKAHWKLGNVRAGRGEDPRADYKRAHRDSWEALRSEPGYADAHYLASEVLKDLADWLAGRGEDPLPPLQEADRALSDFLERHPGLHQGWFHRGRIRGHIGDTRSARGQDPRQAFEEAIEDYTETLNRDPQFVHAVVERAYIRIGLAMALYEMGEDPHSQIDAGVRDGHEALRLNPAESQAAYYVGNGHFFRGEVQYRAGRDPAPEYKKAIPFYTTALTLDPKHKYARLNRASIRRYLGTIAEASGKDPTVWFDGALEDFRIHLKLHPDHEKGARRMLQFLNQRGEFEKAAKILGALLERTDAPNIRALFEEARRLVEGPQWARDLARASATVSGRDYRSAKPLMEAALARAPKEGKTSGVVAGCYYDLACICSLMSAGKAPPFTAVKPPKEAEASKLRTEALNHLRRALGMGWHDLDHMKRDTDLVPIRDLPEFKALLAEYEGKLKKRK